MEYALLVVNAEGGGELKSIGGVDMAYVKPISGLALTGRFIRFLYESEYLGGIPGVSFPYPGGDILIHSFEEAKPPEEPDKGVAVPLPPEAR